ncbi:MAG: hypothetical protein IJ402_04015 [Bacteroidales bacterium]|nr:hypothetical protein [Bacteroidales bacterium]
MNRNKDIESFLRENRPQVKDNPTFLLEVQRKMREVEGIKAEVDRQQKYGKIALVITLVFGLLLGALTMLLTYFVPVDDLIDTDIFVSIRLGVEPIKEYLIVPLIACIVSLLAVLYTSRQNSWSS